MPNFKSIKKNFIFRLEQNHQKSVARIRHMTQRKSFSPVAEPRAATTQTSPKIPKVASDLSNYVEFDKNNSAKKEKSSDMSHHCCADLQPAIKPAL